jgi:hypothetical protein
MLCCLALGVPACAGRRTDRLSTASVKQLFGLDELIKLAHPDRTSIVAVGGAPDPGGGLIAARSDADLVVGGAVLRHGTWWVRTLQEYWTPGYGPEGCASQLARRLAPGGPVIVTQCVSGGTDLVGFVVVIGRPTGYAFPTVLLATSCGVTQAKVEGAKLVVHTSGGLPGAVYPGAKQPTFVFCWQQGRLQTSATDFYRYCASPDDYLMRH